MTTMTMWPQWQSALTAGLMALALSGPVGALDLGLPRFEDLRPRFEAVALGMTPEEVVRAMGGSPNGRTETQTMGVPHLTLEWRDFTNQYVTRFLAGRLYFKQSTDMR